MSGDKKKKGSSGDGFGAMVKKRSLDWAIGGALGLLGLLLVARFSGSWNRVVEAWQYDDGRVELTVPQFMILGDKPFEFDPLIVPRSSKIMRGTLRVNLYTDNLQFTPPLMEFPVADISKPMHLSDIAKGKVVLDAAREGNGVLELQLVSGNRPLDRIVKLIPVRAPYRGKWHITLDDQQGEMDVYQSDNDVFGTYAIEGGGYGSFIGRVDGDVFSAKFNDSKTAKRWAVDAPVERGRTLLIRHNDQSQNARLYAAKDDGWVQTSTTGFSATKND